MAENACACTGNISHHQRIPQERSIWLGGSIEEVRYFLLLSNDLEFIAAEDFLTLEAEYESASKMLNGLIKSLKA